MVSFQNGFCPPGKTTLYEIIHNMPSSTVSSLKGINPWQAGAMEAFKIWSKLTKELQEEHNLDKEMTDQLLSAIKSGHNYIRNHYKHHISTTSTCSSHCLSYCLGDDTQDSGAYSTICEHDHSDTCFQW